MCTHGRSESEAAPVELELTTVDGLPVIRSVGELSALDADSARQTVERIRAERDARYL